MIATSKVNSPTEASNHTIPFLLAFHMLPFNQFYRLTGLSKLGKLPLYGAGTTKILSVLIHCGGLKDVLSN